MPESRASSTTGKRALYRSEKTYPRCILRIVIPERPGWPRTLAIALVAYALSPIDLIPDFIPVLGLIDEVVLLPLGIALLLQLIPEHIMRECRQRAAKQNVLKSRARIIAAVVIGVVWLVMLFLLADVLFRLVFD